MTYVAPVPIDLPKAPNGARTKRLARTGQVFARNLGPLLAQKARGRAPAPEEFSRALRRSFEDLGATYVKFGQLIGSSPGAFGQATSDEFRSCLDTGPAVPFGVVRAAVERTIGGGLEEVFSHFDPQPLASASIAVVHRGVLRDGTVVAVKVLRPGIGNVVATDIDIMEPLFRFFAMQGIPVAGPLFRFLRGFRVQVAEELDLRNEARTMVHFRQLFADAGLDEIVVPAPMPQISGQDVLVMEFLDGVSIDDVDAISGLGHDPKPVIQALLRSWFLTGLRDGLFHGDIHAGNLMLLKDGRLGMVDWGIVGRLDEPTRHLFRRFVEGVLGDPTAWEEINKFFDELVPIPPEMRPQRSASAQDEDRQYIENMLTRPFGEVDLTGAFNGPQMAGDEVTNGHRSPIATWKRMRKLRKFRKVVIGGGVADSGFGQADFMLFKQLLYFERYGKMYLADTALLGDRPFLEHVLSLSPS
jgi:predicted unusual protein kinase regulating ubiquinone biosynthesis (AarF/ABC1/UbiB family)